MTKLTQKDGAPRVPNSINPFACADAGEMAQLIAGLIPREDYNPFEGVMERFQAELKSHYMKEHGVSEEEYERLMDQAREAREQREAQEQERLKGKYVIWHNTICGSKEVLFTENLVEVLRYLKPLHDHLEAVVLDDDYILQLPDGRQMWQLAILDWIKTQG